MHAGIKTVQEVIAPIVTATDRKRLNLKLNLLTQLSVV